jgi:hypothetical protein
MPAIDFSNLTEVEAFISGMAPAARRKLDDHLASTLAKVWLPQPGPQNKAYFHMADEMLYGGAVGGGKSDLLVGLALTAHVRSVIFRLQSVDLDGFWDRLSDVSKAITGTNNAVKKVLKTTDGRVIEGGHLELPGSEKTWQGRPHDLIGFDEAAQLDELKVEFVIKWLRSTTKGQRQRVVFATNPPVPEIKDGQLVDTGTGDWLLRWFAPWLDERFANPAGDGEIRYCFMIREGDRLRTIWVEAPGCYDPKTHKLVAFATPADRAAAIDAGKVMVAKSRTFVRSLLKDNVFLKGTGYAERMASTPEPLKSMLMLGDFTVKGEDHPMQIIPTQWVLHAQQRWNDWQIDPDFKKLIMLVLFGDVAQGGADTTVLAPLFTADYFGELIAQPGRETPDGVAVAQMLIGAQRHGALLGLDGTGGWAGDTMRTLQRDHKIDAEMVVSSHTTGNWTPDMRYRYGNLRAEMWWGFHVALDPKSEYEIALPPSVRLRSQLTAPHWYARGKNMFVESKEELRKRIGSSTDEADAVLGAWYLRDLAMTMSKIEERATDIVEKLNGRGGDYGNQAVPQNDPLKDW